MHADMIKEVVPDGPQTCCRSRRIMSYFYCLLVLITGISVACLHCFSPNEALYIIITLYMLLCVVLLLLNRRLRLGTAKRLHLMPCIAITYLSVLGNLLVRDYALSHIILLMGVLGPLVALLGEPVVQADLMALTYLTLGILNTVIRIYWLGWRTVPEPQVWMRSAAVLVASAFIYALSRLMFGITTQFRSDAMSRVGAKENELAKERELALQLNAITNAVPCAIYRCAMDEQRTLAYVNHGFTALCGYTMGELREKGQGAYISLMHPDDREQAYQEIVQQVQLHEDHSFDVEYRLLATPNGLRYVNDRGMLAADTASDRPYLIGMLTDVTDLYAAQEQLLQTQQELSASSRAKSDFLAHMSHELRTPIHAISGFTDLLLLDKTMTTEQYAHVTAIKTATKSLLYLVNDVLDFSKLSAGQMHVVLAPFLLKDLVRDVCNHISLRAREKNLLFFTDIDPTIPDQLICDEQRLKQVLLNLLTNAVKFTQEGQVLLRISQVTPPPKAELYFEVIDTGIGIRHQDFHRLFEHFQQLDPLLNRTQEGTGLGLTISKQLVKLLGGDLQVESQYGKGSRFFFTLPHDCDDTSPWGHVEDAGAKQLLLMSQRQPWLDNALLQAHRLGVPVAAGNPDVADIPEDVTHVLVDLPTADVGVWSAVLASSAVARAWVTHPEAQPQSLPKQDLMITAPLTARMLANFLNGMQPRIKSPASEEIRASIFSTRDARVLVVDDNPANLLVAVSLLRLFNLTVDEAASARAALTMIAGNAYDMVFMDHIMPEMSGVDVVKQLRAQPETKDLTIVALTANLYSEAQYLFRDAPVQGILTKPLEISRLSAMLARLLPPDKLSHETPMLQPGERAISPRAYFASLNELDYDDGLHHCAGDENLYITLLLALVEELESRHALLMDCLKTLEMSTVALCAHSLKSSLASVGCGGLSKKMAYLERLAKEENTKQTLITGEALLCELEHFAKNLQICVRRMPREIQMEFSLGMHA